MASRFTLIAALAVTLAACGQSAAVANRTPELTLTEGLTFTGAVLGDMTAGVNPGPAVTSYPRVGARPPTSTRCATFYFGEPSGYRDHLYEADIVGMVGGVRYGLYLQITELPLTPIPGVYQFKLGGYSPADAALMTADGNVNTQWYRTEGMRLPSSFSVNSDGRSGTVDVGLADGPRGSVVQITGDWRCG